MKEYPFRSYERKLMNWKPDEAQDFKIWGHESFTKHIFFNLIRNALYFIQAAQKGQIYITLELGDEYNKVHFKDTGAGMKPETKEKLFSSFYSETDFGTGIGLAYCQLIMEKYKGHIECESEYGEFTEFVLMFPVIANDKR